MISKGTGPHAHVAGYGRGWHRGLRHEEIAISTLMRAEIARRYRRCRQATYGRSQLRERAFRPLEIPLVPGSSSSAHGGANGGRARVTSRRGDRRAASKACPKQGVCPASRSSHTIPAHHPGHYHHSSGSPHPDTRGWAQTATPRPQPPHSEDGQRSPPLWSVPPSHLQHTPCPPPSCTLAVRERPAHSAARQNKQLRPHLSCPCARARRLCHES